MVVNILKEQIFTKFYLNRHIIIKAILTCLKKLYIYILCFFEVKYLFDRVLNI